MMLNTLRTDLLADANTSTSFDSSPGVLVRRAPTFSTNSCQFDLRTTPPMDLKIPTIPSKTLPDYRIVFRNAESCLEVQNRILRYRSVSLNEESYLVIQNHIRQQTILFRSTEAYHVIQNLISSRSIETRSAESHLEYRKVSRNAELYFATQKSYLVL